MAAIKPRVKVPSSASAGEEITIKTLINHTMESGRRKDKKTGELIPRKIINSFVVTFNGAEVINMTMHPAMSANPYVQFQMKVPESGDVHFAWTDDDGSVYEATKSISVS